jgi:UDP-N-acetylmuramate dehydrogenase
MMADLKTRPSPTPAALDALAEALGPRVQRRVPLAPFTAMRVGGPADLLVVVESLDELTDAIWEARRLAVPWRILGGGCNVLIADQGLRGLVIINRAVSIAFEDQVVRAASGTKLAVLARRTVENCLAGMAWAAGLPGTVGGAVVGNAGAFGGDVADTLRSAAVLEPDGAVVERERAWFDFAYRDSRLKREAAAEGDGDGQRVVLSAVFQLETGDGAALQARFNEVLAQRRANYPSGSTMGSTFKNPAKGYAGRLIDEAGLKGYRIGGAMIAEEHANFFVNLGDATAEDVLALIRHAQAEVRRQFGVELTPEIELLG